jgi:surface antigen
MGRPIRGGIAALALFGLAGCGGGDLLTHGSKGVFGDGKPLSERVGEAQTATISAVQGGTPGKPIAWTDSVTGLQGALVPDPGEPDAGGCRRYKQTVVLAGEILEGPVTACGQPGGSWKLSGGAGR